MLCVNGVLVDIFGLFDMVGVRLEELLSTNLLDWHVNNLTSLDVVPWELVVIGAVGMVKHDVPLLILNYLCSLL